MTKIKGIDVSRNQGAIDFAKVKASGVDFVMLRIGTGYGQKFNLDAKFKTYYTNAKANGLKIGCYFYSYAKTVARAKAEANEVLNAMKGYSFDYPICFDIEDVTQMKLGKSLITEICHTWLSIVESAGYYASIYTNPDWLRNRIDKSVIDKYDLWLAQWDAKQPAYKCGMWQKSSKGSVNGIKGNVDMDISYKDYATLIKNAGLNGFKKASTTTVTTKPKTENKPTTEQKKITHTVKSGDNLTLIAKKYGTTVNNLVKLNRLKYPTLIWNKNLIRVGWVLKVN